MKVSPEFRGTATIVVVSLLLLMSFVSFLRSSQSEKREVSEILLNQEYKIANFPTRAKEYIRTEDRKTLLQLKQEADKVLSQIIAMEKGNKITSSDKQGIMVLSTIGDSDLSHALELYRKRFEDYYTQIDIMWDASIKSNTTVELQLRSQKQLARGRTKREIIEEGEDSDVVGKAIEFLERRNSSLLLHNRETRFQLEENIKKTKEKNLIFNGLLVILGVMLLIVQGAFFRNNLLTPIRLLRKNLEEFSGEKDLSDTGDIKIIEDRVNNLEDDFNRITTLIEHLGEKDFDANTDGLNEKLAESYDQARDTLIQLANEEFVSKWITEGLARTTETLNSEHFDSIEEMSFAFVRFVTRHLGALQGGVFLRLDQDSDKVVNQVASYAYGKKRFPQRKISTDEGLVGQVMLEKQYVYVEDLPEHYTAISSGLGEAAPRSIIIIPVVHGADEVYGAVEIASYKSLSPHEQEYANAACERFGSAIAVYMMNENTRRLLKESMEVNENLKFKEESLVSKTEEMQEVQDKLSVKLNELSKESNLNKNILDAIGKTMAIIEFDLDGKIITANAMYLSVMGYKLEDIVGKYERVLVTTDEVNSMRYKLLWDSLSNGSFISGEYCRINKRGMEVWLNGTYNPIFGIDGKPYKIIQFAEFTTEQKAKDQTNAERLTAFGLHHPVLDLDLDGKIKAANSAFTDLLGFKRKDYRNMPIVEFFENAKDIRSFKRILRDIKAGTDAVQNFIFVDKNGITKICELNLFPLKTLGGDVQKIMLYMIDKTDQVHLDKKLSTESDAHLLLQNELVTRNTIMDDVCMLLEVDLNGRVIKGNAMVEKWTGKSIDNIIGTPIADMVTTSYQTAISTLLSDPNEKGVRSRMLEYATPRSRAFWGNSISSVIYQGDVPLKYLFIIFDVTDRVEREQGLTQEIERQKTKNTLFRMQQEGNNFSVVEQIFQDESIDLANEDWLEKLPFPSLLTDKEGLLIGDNQLYKDLGLKAIKLIDIPDFLSDQQKQKLSSSVKNASLFEEKIKMQNINKTILLLPLFGVGEHRMLVMIA
ncbi:PAS domain-containing protein [Flammeovirga pectinis]|uniref:PAS domain-containing protein n=1 Tax=Flammeovirga pectinis TaxID=2494373 RepID=A0A3Q9FS61_9BACT|nr:PAS domain-containing protein [Flammeovirga pectinis]AZQ63494.1 PAS domain-containing protein [Flammeovirga pectinis]